MREKRRTRTTGSSDKVQRTTTQTTLRDHFTKTNSGTCPVVKEQDMNVEQTDQVRPSSPELPAQPPQPIRLFPIFTKISSVPERTRDAVINVDDTEVVDITDASDVDVSTGSAILSIHPSPVSEPARATSRSSSPCPIALNDDCESDTNLPHGRTRVHTHGKSKEKATNKWNSSSGGIAPFPSSCSQHVRGLQHAYTCGQAPPGRRVFTNSRPSDEGVLDFLTKGRQSDDLSWTGLGHIHRSLSPKQCQEYIRSLSRDYTEAYPAFARIFDHWESSLRPVETWTRRFRPRRANEVLGNEQHAIYLRDWLRALELDWRQCEPEARDKRKRGGSRGVKRPRVIRTVAKKRGNKKRRVDSDDDLDDFVVYSDEEEEDEEPLGDSEDEYTFCQRTLDRLEGCDANGIAIMRAADTTEPTNFFDKLTNAILITGPPGCGKTAAVYACAEELGWDVFEVYPGIGRRNGANLDRLVGDVGRNHTVQTVQRNARTKTEAKGLQSYLGKNKWGRGTEEQPISVDGAAGVETDRGQEENDGSVRNVGQSLVLLEEVDILFKDDGGFWAGVVELIEGCQRPVVMTCNDLGRVPVGELPLQRVLVFEPCPASVAVTFLQCLSLTEGCLVPHEDLMVLYESTHWKDGIEVREGAISERERFGDLRGCITQLQMLCAGARHGSTSEMHQGEEAGGHVRGSGGAISAACRVAPMASRAERWREMKRESELMSHVDAGFCRVGTGEVSVEGEEEEVVGWMVVREEEEEGHGAREEVDAIRRRSRGEHEVDGTGPMIDPGRRVEEDRSRVAAAGGTGLFLDYMPWIRYMDSGRARGGTRRTRNSR